MKVQIVILVFIIACHLVKSNVTSRLTETDDDEITDDEITDKVIILSEDVADKLIHERSTGGDDLGCIINCFLKKRTTTLSPKDEKCDQNQLQRKCRTRRNICRCPISID